MQTKTRCKMLIMFASCDACIAQQIHVCPCLHVIQGAHFSIKVLVARKIVLVLVLVLVDTVQTPQQLSRTGRCGSAARLNFEVSFIDK